MAWRTWRGAEIYDGCVHDHALYRTLNREVALQADVGAARRVLDLACGTGATVLELLARVTPDTEVVGVDSSEPMIGVARSNVVDPRARFVVAEAERVDESVMPPFERVTCNAAFWQFPDPGGVLRALAALVEPAGRLVFNLPLEREAGADAPVHPFQRALGAAIAEAVGRPLSPPTQRLDLDDVLEAGRRVGWTLESRTVFAPRIAQGALIDLMAVPPLIGPLTEGMDDEERGRVVARAAAAVDRDEIVEIPWVFVTLERGATV